jgi:NADH-quinone oxidoreductase subunit F
MPTAYEPIILRNVGVPNSWDIDVALAHGDYQALPKALSELQPDAIIDLVKNSGLRGRGGAGAPTGMKWGFVPKGKREKYLVVNADESEPGTFSNRAILENDPHQLIEGIAIANFAMQIPMAVIYCRGEFALGHQRLTNAVRQAYDRGFLGKNILGSGFDTDIVVLRGAGAYICGEETALIESAEGNRPMPRPRPPFPAAQGLYNMPSNVQNVETLCNVPMLISNGVEWYTSIGTAPRNTGPKIYCVSGHVRNPGNKELPLDTTLRDLIYEHSGGMIGDRPVKAVIPGGSSAAMVPGDNLDFKMDFDTLASMGSMLGSGGVVIMNDTTCIPCAVRRISEFYNHESCGKCTPCREGTMWMVKLLRRITGGDATSADIDQLDRVAKTIGFGPPNNLTLCALGDASTSCVTSGIRLFRDEFEYHARTGKCPTARVPVGV